ncbi:MAG TPA: glycosyltransferase family 4 protein [Gaiellaceae bacterium]|nr:glycosyltransferase family 4 protein [Gaiellaceae bacterium]HWJ45468.1 glycosyltransferase family 4 protein [Gaiellaceae bacterium]
MTRPLRVLLVSANFRPSIGGIERYTEILAHALASRGHTVTVAACATDGARAGEERDGDVRVVRLRATDVLDTRLGVPVPLPEPVSAARTLRRLIRDADVANPQDALYPTTLLTLSLAKTSVLTQHVGFVPQRSRALDSAERAAIAAVGPVARRATRVAAYNPAVAEWARQTWTLEHVEVVPPGVPPAPEVDAGEVRRRYGLPLDRFVALFAGRDVHKKGLDLFLAAADRDYELVAVSDRPGMLPFVEPEEFRRLLAAVDAFVLPSEGEGFPLTLQEALVTGLPCVIAAGPGYEQYLRDNEAVVVERKPDAIRAALKRLATEAAYRQELSARAAEAGRREFGVDRFSAAYERLYRDAIAAAQPMPARP